MSDTPSNREVMQRVALYLGGFMGPFAGQALGVILPEFATSFDITLSQASLTLSVYLLPFALVMLISTNLVRSQSPSRVVVVAFAVTLVAALVATLAPWWSLFLAAYAVMGIANAFTTPVLIVVLKRITPANQLGGVLGTYTAMQSLGILSAPLVAGLVADWSWRWLFVLTLAGALFILVVRLPHVPAQTAQTADKGDIVWLPIVVKMAACYAVGIAVIGMPFIIALRAGTVFSLGPTARGLVVMCGGIAAFLFSRYMGKLASRVGAARMLTGALAVAGVGMALLPLMPWLAAVALVWAATMLAAQTAQTSINMETLKAAGGERMLSTVQAFRYFGSSSTPLLIYPIYTAQPIAAFVVAGAILGVAAAAQLLGTRGESTPREHAQR